MTPSDTRDRPGGLRITVTRDAQTYAVGLDGDVDLATVGRLRSAVAEAVASACPQIVLDLGACDFIDSTGVGAVVALHHDAMAAGRTLQIRPGGRSVMRVFGVIGLLDELPFAAAT